MADVAETTTVEEIKPKKKEGLFSKKNKRILTDPLDGDNPITVQVLGICSALAVTGQMKPSLVMGIAVVFVMVCSSVLTSLLRNTIPSRIRIVVQLAIIATFVILVNELLLAFVYDTAKGLGAFVGLIITNCIVMGRLEAFAMGNKPWPSFLDALGNAMGYAIILLMVAFIRELFGSGTLFGAKIFPDSLATNGLMLYSSGACIVVGILIWIQRYLNVFREED